MIEGTQFSDVLFFVPEKVNKMGEENAGCRNLMFIGEKTFEMTFPRGPKGAAFQPAAMRATLVIVAGGRTRGILYGVRESSNKSTKKDSWLGTFDKAEGLLGGPLYRWHYDNFKGDPEAAAKHIATIASPSAAAKLPHLSMHQDCRSWHGSGRRSGIRRTVGTRQSSGA